jgi:micrococcal nuclease
VKKILSLIIVLVLSTSVQSAEDIYGIVVSVADGDTVTLKANDITHKIRLAEIDTPEKDQPYGLTATSALTDLLLTHRVRVKVVKESDRYGRVIGRIFIEQKDVSAYMVEQGHAMVYHRYLTDKSLLALEANAKYKKLGLWGLPEEDRVEPWLWRQQQREKVAAKWK